MKRFLTLCLALLLLLPVLPVHGTEDSLEQVIIDSFSDGEAVDISRFQVTKPQLVDVFHRLSLKGSLPWYAERNFSCSLSDTSDQVMLFQPCTLDPQKYNRDQYQRAIAEILSASVHPGMEPWQIALSVHDYLIAHYAYDQTLTKHTGYDLLVNGSAVCTGYAYAYMDLMHRVGIECVVVESPDMADGEGHAWNLIKLGGNWYHVDVTWDDPTPEVYGYVSHRYFLLTDEEIYLHSSAGHYDWETEIHCTDTAYSSSFWRNVTSQVLYQDRDICYYRVQDNWTLHIIRRTENSGEELPLLSQSAAVIDIGSGPSTYEHNSLSLWNGKLYFSTESNVYTMKPDGTELTSVYTYDTSQNLKYILSCFVDADRLYLTLSDCTFNTSAEIVDLESSGFHVHTYVPAKVVPPTCTKGGYTEFACSCGISYRGAETAPVGHSYEKTILKKPTLTQEGQAEYICSACGDHYEESLPKTGFGELLYPWGILIIPAAAALAAGIASAKRRRKR